VKEDNNKTSFDAILEAYIHVKGCRNTIKGSFSSLMVESLGTPR
jgi:hypothetical protein